MEESRPSTTPQVAEPKKITPEVRQEEKALTEEYTAAHADVPAVAPSGGDFHDAFPLKEGSDDVVVVMGDVAGHGPEQTAQAEHMQKLLSDVLALGLSPAEALHAVNAMIEPDPNFEGFGTVFVGTLKAETGKLTYASGGHEPALIAPSSASAPAEIKELPGTGPPVGAFPSELAQYDEQEATIPPGGTLLLYTDGITEARPPQDRRKLLGIERIKAMFARYAPLSPRLLISRLLARVKSFCRGWFHDDIAVLALRRRSLQVPDAAPPEES